MSLSAISQFFSTAFDGITLQLPSLAAVVALCVALIMLVVSAFVSASEIAFFSLSSVDMNRCSESDYSADKRILQLLKNPERLLATILITNDFVNVGIVMLLNFFFMDIIHFPESAQWVEFVLLTVLLTFVLLLFGEVMPKLYSKNNSYSFARFASGGLYFISRLLVPFSAVLVKSAAFTDRLESKGGYSLSVDELEQALELTDKKEISEQKNMLEGIIRFGDETVKDIMTSRMDMVMLDIRASYSEVLRCAAENAHSVSLVKMPANTLGNIISTAQNTTV